MTHRVDCDTLEKLNHANLIHMILDGIAASSHLDSSAEILDIAGLDISDFLEGKGTANFEHRNDSPEDIVGKVIYARKIFRAEDCEDDRQLAYWKQCLKPFLYVKIELFDGEQHPGAVALAALIRYYHNRGERIQAGYSIEGSTLKREGNNLVRSVARKVAITLKPCNKSCLSGVLEDPAAQQFVQKAEGGGTVPTIEVDTLIFSDAGGSDDFVSAAQHLGKTLTAGGYDAAPSTLTQGSALQSEDRSRLKAAYRAWDRKRPLREFLKHELPGISKEYREHFADAIEQLELRKGMAGVDLLVTNVGTKLSNTQIAMVQGAFVPTVEAIKDDRAVIGYTAMGEPLVVTPSHPVNAPALDASSSVFAQSANVASAFYRIVAEHWGLPADVCAPAVANQLLLVSQPMDGYLPFCHPTAQAALPDLTASGMLQKLFLADLLLGAQSRSAASLLYSPLSGLRLSETPDAFRHQDLRVGCYPLQEPLGATAYGWLMQINRNALSFALVEAGVPHLVAVKVIERLDKLRERVHEDMSLALTTFVLGS